jgi:hypothetical protein
MRYAPVLFLVLGMIAAACASHPSSQGRTAVSSALASPRPEAFLVHHTEGSVIVSVDPAVPSARLAAVFGVTGIPPLILPLILPLELVIQHQGTQPLRLSQEGLVLELPDGSQSRPLPITAVARDVVPRHTIVTQERARPPQALSPGEAFFLAAIGVGGLIGEHRTQAHVAAEHASAYRSKALQEVILAPGDTVSGFVFFSSPMARGFREAALLLQFVEATATPAVVVRLPLSGLGGGERLGRP